MGISEAFFYIFVCLFVLYLWHDSKKTDAVLEDGPLV